MIGKTPGGSGSGGGAHDRRLRRLRGDRRHNEARAQEPILRVAAAHAAPKEIIVVGARPQFAIRERERAGRRHRPVYGVDHQNAIRCRFHARARGVMNCQARRAARAAAVNDQLVGRRTIGTQIGVKRDPAAHASIAHDRQRFVAAQQRWIADGWREDDIAGVIDWVVRFELPVIVHVVLPLSVMFTELLELVVMAPVSCEPVAVKLVVPDSRVFSSTPLPLVIDDPLTAISATGTCHMDASAAEVTVALLLI